MPRLPRLVLPCALFLTSCGDHAPPAPREAPRPVEVYALSPVDPAGPTVISGSVTSWKEQDVAFEVGGRVSFVQEPGTSLEGRWEEGGKVHIEGQLLAELDDRPYRIAVASAEAAVSVSQEQVAVTDAQLEQVLPANLRVAEAEVRHAEAEYKRYLEASETNAVSGSDLERAETARDVTAANVEQAEAAFASKQAEKRSLEANLAQVKEQLEDAHWQLGRCRLFAPFTAEVSEVFVEAGGFVRAGEHVAHLVMMDPIQVDIAVSATTLRELERYQDVQLQVPGLSEPVSGRIYDLATAADPRTRTFRVSIIVRNQQRIGALTHGDPELDLPRVERLIVPVKVDPLDPEGAWYVEARRSLREDDQGWFVWASMDRPEDLDRERPVMTLRKQRVTPGDELLNYQGIYVMRELADSGGMTGSTPLPLDVPAGFEEGGQVLVADTGWVLRPGQIVSVLLAGEAPEPGLFVPMSAVLPEEGEHGRVFVVEDGVARSVRLDLSDRMGPLVRVRATNTEDAGRVGPGTQVVRQAHFLHEGEPVRVVRTHEVRP